MQNNNPCRNLRDIDIYRKFHFVGVERVIKSLDISLECYSIMNSLGLPYIKTINLVIYVKVHWLKRKTKFSLQEITNGETRSEIGSQVAEIKSCEIFPDVLDAEKWKLVVQ